MAANQTSYLQFSSPSRRVLVPFPRSELAHGVFANIYLGVYTGLTWRWHHIYSMDSYTQMQKFSICTNIHATTCLPLTSNYNFITGDPSNILYDIQ